MRPLHSISATSVVSVLCVAPLGAQGVPQLTVFGLDYKGKSISLPDSFSAVPITEADLLVPQTLLPQLGPLQPPGIV